MELIADGPYGLPVISIRYDGLDAADHAIELTLLGESMTGLGRVIGTVGHFAYTLRYSKNKDAQDVRVLAQEARANCFTFDAVLQWVKDFGLVEGAATAFITGAIAWIVNRNAHKKQEMKALKESLDLAIRELARGNRETFDRALQSVERMAQGLKPALRQAVAPVGRSCKTMTIGRSIVIDEATAEAIRSLDSDELTELRDWPLMITELDVESGSAKVRMPGAEAGRRIRAKITDPAVQMEQSLYAESLYARTELVVQAKALMREGEVITLFVSDASRRDENPDSNSPR